MSLESTPYMGTIEAKVRLPPPPSHIHSAQFFPRAQFPVRAISEFLVEGIRDQRGVVILATLHHHRIIAEELANAGLDVDALEECGQLKLLDAEEILKVMSFEGVVNLDRFETYIAYPVRLLAQEWGGVTAYGELVGILCDERKYTSAMLVEAAWNKVCEEQSVSLLCGYHYNDSISEFSSEVMSQIRGLHNHVVPLVEASPEIRLKGKETFTFNGMTLLGSMQSGVCICDQEGRILYYNKKAAELWGQSPDLTQSKVSDVFDYVNSDGSIVAFGDGVFSKALREHVAVTGQELLLQRRDGTRLPIDLNITPLQNEDEVQWGAIFLMNDISERKNAEKILYRRTEELARSNAELAQFARVASHDIKEPLRMMRIYSQILQRSLGDKLQAADQVALSNIVNSAKHVYELIDSLLNYSSVGGNAQRELFDANHSFTVALHNLANLVAETNAVVACAPLPPIHGNSALFSQVLQNLISNGIKFCKGTTPRVRVSVAQSKGDWVFSVQDNGIGIEPRFFDRIFVIYQRLHTQRDFPGVGIGLAICKKIVEWHGGRIWVESTPGEGSKFSFTIPQAGDRYGEKI